MKVCPVCGNVSSYNSYFQKIVCNKCGWNQDISEVERKAVYAGSFDPFTNGHLWVVKEAAKMFDTVYVCIANNPGKTRHSLPIAMKVAIEEVLNRHDITNVDVVIYDGFVADFAREKEADYLVRGLRNTSDYLYEENIAKINYEINPTLKTIYYRANNDIISSSLIRELLKYGKDISQYVPKEVEHILTGGKNNES